MGESVVGFLVERLSDLLNEESNALHGLRDQVEENLVELRSLQGLLKDAGAKRNQEHIRIWAADVRKLAYDATDILESYILLIKDADKRNGESVLKRHVRTIKNRISELTIRSRKYGLRSLAEEEDDSSRINRRQSQLNRAYSHVVVDQEVIGLEEDVRQLVAHLTNDKNGDKCYRVISIYGMGGLGKTTLAGKVYNHPTIKRHFDCLCWVCISQKWQTNDVLQNILVKLSPERRNEDLNLRDDQLVKHIFGILHGKRYLVVLDDIWSSDAWDCLKAAFPIQNMGSKILLTTRNIEVARHVELESLLHQPQFLNEEQSWELLQMKTSIKRNHTDPRDAIKMEKLGKEMIKHCKGLPLAILVLGGILVTKPTLTQWEMVHKNIETSLRRGQGLGQQHQAEVEEMLVSSYTDLPNQLKSCFLYLSKFPEDCEIEAERLYQLWIAEGMVLSKDRREEETMTDVAECYMGELSHRCMVQVEFEKESSSFRKFKSCHLHDLMRDLSLKKAKEEDFFEILDIQNGNNHEFGESSSSSSDYTLQAIILDDLLFLLAMKFLEMMYN